MGRTITTTIETDDGDTETTSVYVAGHEAGQADVFTDGDGVTHRIADMSESQLVAAMNHIEGNGGEYMAGWACTCGLSGKPLSELIDNPDACGKCQAVSDLSDTLGMTRAISSPLYQALFDAKQNTATYLKRRKQVARMRRRLSLLDQASEWETANGRVFRLEDMDVRHLSNTRAWLVNNADWFVSLYLKLELLDGTFERHEGHNPWVHRGAYDGWMEITPLVRRIDELLAMATDDDWEAAEAEQAAREAYFAENGRWPDD